MNKAIEAALKDRLVLHETSACELLELITAYEFGPWTAVEKQMAITVIASVLDASWDAGAALAAAQVAGEDGRIANALRQHWLTGIECDHSTKTDIATCSCALWKSEPMPTVGAAVDAWINHVMEQADLALSPGKDDAERIRLYGMAESCAVSVLQRLIANYQTDRDEIEDSDLDNEQSITINFRGTLSDIRNAGKAIQCFRALRDRGAVSPGKVEGWREERERYEEALRVIRDMAICEEGETAEERYLIVEACRDVARAALLRQAQQ